MALVVVELSYWSRLALNSKVLPSSASKVLRIKACVTIAEKFLMTKNSNLSC